MTGCALPSPQVPQLAVCLVTTAHDYQQFLLKTLKGDVLSRELIAESEKDYTPFLRPYYTIYGLYAFGHFIECFDDANGFTAECDAARIHCDTGAFGFYPLIDRDETAESKPPNRTKPPKPPNETAEIDRRARAGAF